MRSTMLAEFLAVERAFIAADDEFLAGLRNVFGVDDAPGTSPPRARLPFWKLKNGLQLRGAWYDPFGDEFVVTFEAGPVFHVPRAKLPHEGVVFAVALDEFRHGVGVAFADGSATDFSSDWVLYEACEEYRQDQVSRTQQPVDFGARIRQVRLAKGLKAIEVASACSMAASNYARLESSAHQPSIDTLSRVADALGVTLASLVVRK